MSTQPTPPHAEISLHQWLNWLFKLVLLIVFLDAVFFGIAGRLDWLGAWVFTLFYVAFVIFFVVWTARNAPDLLAERSTTAANVKSWDKIILTLYTVALIALLVVAALDAGRFRWSEMPLVGHIVGFLGLAVTGVWIWWVSATNAFLSRHARIQDDRGQRVVTSGPYAYVRHPMYAALIPFVLCVALTLGSWWSLVPGAVIAILMIIRTALEDRMLHEELPGYREYAQKVRYRLLPGIW